MTDCLHCGAPMIVGGSHDCDEEYGGEYIIVTNYSCPDCHATMLFYTPNEETAPQ